MNILRTIKFVFPIFTILFSIQNAEARMPDNWKKRSADTELKLKKRVRDCVQGSSRFDMDINNVRAALLSSGDVWWDLTNAVYVVPKVAPGSTAKAVSSLYAGAVWLGGKDPSGNLKVACQSYRSGTATDFWPGPLDKTGNTEAAQCERWDKHFVVYRTDIDSARALYRRAKEENPNDPSVDCELIPENLRGWPATGNPHFFDINQFTLPRDTQGLAKFFDEDGDKLYDPCKGDFPIIDVDGCESITAIPDQMIFWIYNDNGNTHTQALNSTAIQMEVQVQAFAYQTNDELNDMTFQRYKLINRAVTDIDSTFFAMWVDPDLGCPDDDYVGCDTTRDLMFVYNQDAVDGTTGDRCNNEIATYGSKIPILGVDYFRGPKDEFGRELGMSSFTYHLNGGGTPIPLPATTDPETAVEYYNYLTGRWRDGTPFSFGGSGYNPASTQRINYAFTDAPNNPTGWSMASAALPFGDRRTIQASGPFKLRPGAINELIIGVPWVADQPHPAPDITRLQAADDIAQSLFNNCFKIFDGPSAPDMCPLGLDQEIVLILTNNPDSTVNNNARERYQERGLKIPASEKDTLYKFQGYKIYQLRNENVGVAELEDASKSRLIFQVDIQDSISKIFNWTSQSDPNFPGRTIYTPILKTDGSNQGIRHTFSVKEDKFAAGDDKRLINNKKYYFIAVAYAYNNYAKFDEKRSQGQQEPFVVGRLNIGDKNRGNKPYEITPRAITNIKLGAGFGDGTSVSRLDGVGTGNVFLDLTDETVQKILDKTFDGTLVYKAGRGPIGIKIYNPLEVLDGEYELTLRDNNMIDNVLDKNGRWTLKNLTLNESVVSDTTIAALNEQVIAKFGFSVTIGQVAETGLTPLIDKSNGAIGSEITYENKTGSQWLTAVEDDAPFIGSINITNYLKTNPNEADFALDPNQSLSRISPIFKPYYLLDYIERAEPYISPVWQESTNNIVRNDTSIRKLNNINIIFTKDKSKWSRCVVVETASRAYFNKGNNPDNWPTFDGTEGGARMFDLRRAPSVGKEADAQGRPRQDGDGQGMGWFPGYAIDVETGKRLNIFFGENTAFDPKTGLYTEGTAGINRDMIWNPSSQAFLGLPIGFNPYYAAFFGGQHFVYVTSQVYDECSQLRQRFGAAGTLQKSFGTRFITWAGLPYVTPNSKLLSYANGLIPNDVTVKLRVRNPYAVEKGKGTNQNYPSYRFVLNGKQAQELTPAGKDSALNAVRVVPNPYYGFSAYERSELGTTVKLTNLPAQATVTIYTLDGKYVRQFKRDERPVKTNPVTAPGVLFKPIETALEWDLKNEKGIPVGSGVYLIHIATAEGERTLKFFAVQRKFDASRL